MASTSACSALPLAEVMSAEQPNERCRVEITREPDGALHIASVESAVCGGMRYGDAGTAINDVRFAPSYEGPVTWELNNPQCFFGHTGRCDEASVG